MKLKAGNPQRPAPEVPEAVHGAWAAAGPGWLPASSGLACTLVHSPVQRFSRPWCWALPAPRHLPRRMAPLGQGLPVPPGRVRPVEQRLSPGPRRCDVGPPNQCSGANRGHGTTNFSPSQSGTSLDVARALPCGRTRGGGWELCGWENLMRHPLAPAPGSGPSAVPQQGGGPPSSQSQRLDASAPRTAQGVGRRGQATRRLLSFPLHCRKTKLRSRGQKC